MDELNVGVDFSYDTWYNALSTIFSVI